MRNNRVFSIIFFSVLGIALVYFFYLSSQGNPRHNWHETYDSESSQPYGTSFIRQMLKSYSGDDFVFNTNNPVHKLLDSLRGQQETMYVFIGGSLYLDTMDISALKKFVESGNDAFIICLETPYYLMDAFYTHDCTYDLNYHTVDTLPIQANFYHPAFVSKRSYPFAYRINDKDRSYYWSYLNNEVLCDSVRSVVPLGYFNDDRVNFFKLPLGNGNLYAHTNPVLFTNYFMTSERNTEYASSVFSHSSFRNIIWDDYSKDPFFKGDRNPYYNPLYFVMQQPALRYAWWIMVVLALLYVVFAAKRQQRFIPVTEPKVNTSLAFLQTVSSLYYHNQNHTSMAHKKMRHFLHFVRTRYNLSTHKTDADFIKKLSAKSQVSEADIETIFNQYKIIENFQDIYSARLADLYEAIHHFYTQAK